MLQGDAQVDGDLPDAGADVGDIGLTESERIELLGK
jgi:hypothetical protein